MKNNEINRKDVTVPIHKSETFNFSGFNPNYSMMFHRDGKTIGTLDFNGSQMTFSGDMEDSAKIFFEFIAGSFKNRLEQERIAEREACAKLCDSYQDIPATEPRHCAEDIRARGEA